MIGALFGLWRRLTQRPQGPVTALFEPPALTPATNADRTEAPMLSQPDTRYRLMADSLQQARRRVGVREVPPDSNRGPAVELYQASVGITPGKPWCAAFVWYCVEAAWREINGTEQSLPVPLKRTGWSHAMWEWLEERGQTYTVEDVIRGQAIPPGALFFLWGPVSWSNAGGVRHVGFVEGIDQLEQSAFTVEGNTSTAGSREGGGVYRLERGLQSVYRFGIYGV